MKTRYIPEGATENVIEDAKLVVYRFVSNGREAFIAYKGRQKKPLQHAAFTSLDYLEETLANLIKRETEREESKKARQNASHELNVGDVVYAMWGCEQTNVDFYQVVRVPSGRSAVVRAIKQDLHSDGPQSMTGSVTPCIDQFVDGSEEINRRTVDKHCLSDIGQSRGQLVKWDGTPRRVSFYG